MTTQIYPLANGVDGNPLEVPGHAVAWRVRRGGGRRGRPRVVFDSETGKQLEVPLTASVEELVARGCPPGRYRLEAIDSAGQAIPGIVGITEVFHTEAGDDLEDEEPRETTLVERQMQLIEQQNNVLFRVIDSMAGAFGTVQPSFPPPPAPALPIPSGIGGIANFITNLKPEAVQAMVKVFGELSKIGRGGDEGDGGGFAGFGTEGGEA